MTIENVFIGSICKCPKLFILSEKAINVENSSEFFSNISFYRHSLREKAFWEVAQKESSQPKGMSNIKILEKIFSGQDEIHCQ